MEYQPLAMPFLCKPSRWGMVSTYVDAGNGPTVGGGKLPDCGRWDWYLMIVDDEPDQTCRGGNSYDDVVCLMEIMRETLQRP